MAKELYVQKYLRIGHALEELELNHNIIPRVDEELGVVALNYNQLLAKFDNPIPNECRALYLEVGTWNIVSKSFDKFFNYSEQYAAPVDLSNSYVTEKLDGSLICFYYYKDKWYAGTRSSPQAKGNLGDKDTDFRYLIDKTIKYMGYDGFDLFTDKLDKNIFYSFELTTPENAIIVPYNDYKLTLIGAWNKSTLEEISIYNIDGFNLPQYYKYENMDEIVDIANSKGAWETEGFVVVDNNFNRVKIKGKDYVSAARISSSLCTLKNKIQMAISDSYDDALAYLPNHISDELKIINSNISNLVKDIAITYETIKDIETQKDFALMAVKYFYSGILFQLRKNKGNINDIVSYLQLLSDSSMENLYLKCC